MTSDDQTRCSVCGHDIAGDVYARGHVGYGIPVPQIHHDLCSIACSHCEDIEGREVVVIDLTEDD